MSREKTNTDEVEKTDVDLEALEEISEDGEMGDLIPRMNVNVPANVDPKDEPKNLIADEQLLGVYDEVLTNIRKDREEIDELLAKFVDMALNDGDATTSTKEAVVNLIKIKTDTSDKMSKIADLMTRVKMRDPFPKYLAAHQNNTINITKYTKPLVNEYFARLADD